MLKSLEEIPSSTAAPQKASTERELYLKQLENKLASVSNYSDLECAVALWRAGCKQALLELQCWMRDKEGVTISVQEVANRLGISPVIKLHFQGDDDIMLSDEGGECSPNG